MKLFYIFSNNDLDGPTLRLFPSESDRDSRWHSILNDRRGEHPDFDEALDKANAGSGTDDWDEVEDIFEDAVKGEWETWTLDEAEFASPLDIAREVESAVYEAFDTYRDAHIGADFAYLLSAIISEGRTTVDWSPECPIGPLREFVALAFGPGHPIWPFITGCESIGFPEGTRISVNGASPIAWRDFVIENSGDLSEITDAIGDLRRDKTAIVGGGAAPTFTLAIVEPPSEEDPQN